MENKENEQTREQQLSNYLGLLSEVEIEYIKAGYKAIYNEPKILESPSAHDFMQSILIGFRSLRTREQLMEVDSLASTIDGKFIYIENNDTITVS